jgi:hypothetical protein
MNYNSTGTIKRWKATGRKRNEMKLSMGRRKENSIS